MSRADPSAGAALVAMPTPMTVVPSTSITLGTPECRTAKVTAATTSWSAWIAAVISIPFDLHVAGKTLPTASGRIRVMNRQVLLKLHALAAIGACVLVSGCARFSGTLPSEYQRSSGTISFVDMQELPGFEGVSDDELLERLSRAEAQRTRTDLPQLRRLSVEEARTELEEFWIPTNLPTALTCRELRLS